MNDVILTPCVQNCVIDETVIMVKQITHLPSLSTASKYKHLISLNTHYMNYQCCTLRRKVCRCRQTKLVSVFRSFLVPSLPFINYCQTKQDDGTVIGNIPPFPSLILSSLHYVCICIILAIVATRDAWVNTTHATNRKVRSSYLRIEAAIWSV